MLFQCRPIFGILGKCLSFSDSPINARVAWTKIQMDTSIYTTNDGEYVLFTILKSYHEERACFSLGDEDMQLDSTEKDLLDAAADAERQYEAESMEVEEDLQTPEAESLVSGDEDYKEEESTEEEEPNHPDSASEDSPG